jgi:hypothetical protein
VCFEPAQNYGWGYEEAVVDPSMLSQTIGGQDHVDESNATGEPRTRHAVTQAQWVEYQAMINTVGTASLFLSLLIMTTTRPNERSTGNSQRFLQ